MILGAEKSVETGRLVFLIRCVDCQEVHHVDAIGVIREDVEALPELRDRAWRCQRCEALWRTTAAYQLQELGKAVRELKRAVLESLEGLFVKLRTLRRP